MIACVKKDNKKKLCIKMKVIYGNKKKGFLCVGQIFEKLNYITRLEIKNNNHECLLNIILMFIFGLILQQTNKS